MRVFLSGFMGAGKTTVGQLLAERLRWSFVDLDQAIETAAGQSVRAIFDASGEAAFRGLERAALAAAVAADPVVIATGGGTLATEEGLRFARRHGLIVWLNPAFSTIVARIGARGKTDRPLFGDEAQALRLYQERLPAYRSADLVVEVGPGEEAAEVAGRLALLLAERACVS